MVRWYLYKVDTSLFTYYQYMKNELAQWLLMLVFEAYLKVSIPECRRQGAGHRYTGRQNSSPLSVGLACPPFLPSDEESFIAAVGHHSSKTIVRSTHISSINTLRPGASHWHTANIIRRRIPLSSHQTSQHGCGVEHEALRTFVAHFSVAGVFGLVDRF